MKAGTDDGAIPAKVSLSARATVTPRSGRDGGAKQGDSVVPPAKRSPQPNGWDAELLYAPA